MEDFKLDIWRCHPNSAKIVRAEKTLNGMANPVGTKLCRPYASGNQLGWWIFPAVDVDILWKGGKEFEHKLPKFWTNSEYQLVKSLIRPSDNTNVEDWCTEGGRSKFTWGAIEPGVVQFWTGVILKTPPGWCLQIRSPANFPPQEFRVMEGILETDWMQYDIWINLIFTVQDKWIKIRQDSWPPVAQIIPVRRETVDAEWEIGNDSLLHRDTEEANRVFEYWVHYNDQKYCHGGKYPMSEDPDDEGRKDSTTFWRERKKFMKKCPFEPELDSPKPLKDKKSTKIKNKLFKGK